MSTPTPAPNDSLAEPMTQEDLRDARDQFRGRIDSLESDSRRCFWPIQDPGAPGPAFFPPVMYAFATVDYFSSFWEGWNEREIGRNQTKRMADFMERYLLYPQKESQLAIAFWRHKLMHTAEPRALTDTDTHERYLWLMGTPPDITHHMRLRPIPDKLKESVLEFCVFDMIRDLREGVFGPRGSFEDLRANVKRQRCYRKCLKEFESYTFKSLPQETGPSSTHSIDSDAEPSHE